MTSKTTNQIKALLTLMVFTSLPVLAEEVAPSVDPLEPLNRAVFRFNDVADRVVLRPVATLYNKLMPKPFNKLISNFFANFETIPTIGNDILQGNFYQATSDSWRLVINSTVGVGGLFDVAAKIGLEPNNEDFGLTLAKWGYKDSRYLVLPFFGPSTFRDGIGMPANYYLFSLYPYINPAVTRYSIYGVGVVSRRADLLRFQNVMQQAALDEYTFVRNAYLQRRNYQIQRNEELSSPYMDKNKQQEEERLTLNQEEENS